MLDFDDASASDTYYVKALFGIGLMLIIAMFLILFGFTNITHFPFDYKHLIIKHLSIIIASINMKVHFYICTH